MGEISDAVTDESSGGALELLLRVAGPCFFLWMQYSTFMTAQAISARKSVGSIPLLPFLSLFMNCIVWTFYGLLKDDMTVLVPNGLGVATGGYCTYVYYTFSTPKQRQESVKFARTSVALFVLNTFLFLDSDAYHIGLIGCCLAVCLMGSPLSALQTVLESASTESMPFATSLAAFLNSLSWTAYGGFISHDPMIYVPNLLGLAITSVQMLLFAKYGISSGIESGSGNSGRSGSVSSDALSGMLAMPTMGSEA